jgi:hypothetical protein
MRSLGLALIPSALLAAVGCDYSGDWLFAGEVEGVPGVVHLGPLTPIDVTSPADITSGTLYGEVGPTGTTEPGGVTFTFLGSGGHVCVWVDAELLFYNQSVSANPTSKFAYPDNVFDDGDLDLAAGFSAYYNGSPGERTGSFEVRYQDALGNPVTVALNECVIGGLNSGTGAHSGRGAPEYCTIRNTQPGVEYLVLAEVWSTPLDDDRLSYGLVVSNGTCEELAAASPAQAEECVVIGEALDAGSDPGPWIGADAAPTRAQSDEYERAYCDSRGTLEFCEAEALQSDCTDPENRCFCGNLEDTPRGGSF